MNDAEVVITANGLEDLEAVLDMDLKPCCVVDLVIRTNAPDLKSVRNLFRHTARKMECVGVYHVITQILEHTNAVGIVGTTPPRRYTIIMEGIGVKPATGKQ